MIHVLLMITRVYPVQAQHAFMLQMAFVKAAKTAQIAQRKSLFMQQPCSTGAGSNRFTQAMN